MFPQISTQRLTLRNLVLDDSETMFEYRSHPDVCRYQFWEPETLQEVQLFIEKNSTAEFNASGWYQIAIVRQEDNLLIGDCAVHILESEPRVAELAITISPAAQSKGYACESLVALIDCLFHKFDKHRVFASVDPLNVASMALMRRIGLRMEAHFVQSLWFKDRWADDVVFAILKAEWQTRLAN
ncbi:MAG: GNAT family N-acetyltransferase [Candidatus Obscuribacterales bacterium]|nr:GNAT family N-acetyltransferase [Candidatus Obscuribacterales bacterium]